MVLYLRMFPDLKPLILDKSRYQQARTCLEEVRKRNQTISRASVVTIQQILSKNEYKARQKLFALRYLKDCFQQGNPHFIQEVQNEIMPVLHRIIQDSTQMSRYSLYAEQFYKTETELKTFKSQILSMFILAQQCISNWADWMTVVARMPNRFLTLRSQLQREGIEFTGQNQYFTRDNKEDFVANYTGRYRDNEMISGLLAKELPRIFHPIPVASQQKSLLRQSSYSKKLDLVLLSMSELRESNLPTAQLQRQMSRVEQAFEQLISSYIHQVEQFDQKFVNEYYSKLEAIIRSITLKVNATKDNSIRNLSQNSVRNSEISVQSYPKQKAQYSVNVIQPPSNKSISAQSHSQDKSYQEISDSQMNGTFVVQDSESNSNVSRSSSKHPPIRIPSSRPTSNLPQASTIKPSIPVLKSPPVLTHNLPHFSPPKPPIQASMPVDESPKSVRIDEGKNQKIEYISNSIGILSVPSTHTAERNRIQDNKNHSLYDQSSHSQIGTGSNKLNSNMQRLDRGQPKINQKLYNENRLAEELLNERRSNFQLSQHLLNLQMKVQSLENQIERRSQGHSHQINSLPSPRNGSVSKARSLTCRMEQNNFFRQQEHTHASNVHLRDTLGSNNVNKFKLVVLGANNTLMNNEMIRVKFSNRQITNNKALHLQSRIKVVSSGRCRSILIRYKNYKQLDLWTRPVQFSRESEAYQELVCNAIDLPLPLVEANVAIDDQLHKLVLPIMLINFLVSGQVTPDRFRAALIEDQKHIIKSRTIRLNPIMIPSPGTFMKYFPNSFESPKDQNTFQCGFLYPYTQTILLLQIQTLANQRAVFRVLQVGARVRPKLAHEFLDNLIFLFCI